MTVKALIVFVVAAILLMAMQAQEKPVNKHVRTMAAIVVLVSGAVVLLGLFGLFPQPVMD